MKLTWLIPLGALVLSVLPCSAEIYRSPNGFAVEVPPHWFMVTQTSLADSVDPIEGNPEVLENVAPQTRESMRELAATSLVEYFFDRRTAKEGLPGTNLNVVVEPGLVPSNARQLAVSVEEMRYMLRALEAVAGRPLKVLDFSFVELSGARASLIVYESPIDGFIGAQYSVPASSDVRVVITAGYRVGSEPEAQAEIREILDTFEITGVPERPFPESIEWKVGRTKPN